MKTGSPLISSLLLLLFLPFLPAALPAAEAGTEAPGDRIVLLVSFDGFRADYADKWALENFHFLAQRGATAAGLVPSFPSNTFPNHYTLVTGLHPGRHGLVDNRFYDPVRERHYAMGDAQAVADPAFYGGLPLWRHVQHHGLKSAAYFWVGSEAAVAGGRPDYYRRYDGGVPNPARIAQVLDWLALPPGDRPAFITLYFSLVDSAGHHSGPDSPQTEDAAREADRLLGLLLAGLRRDGMPAVDLIVVSDHGMYPVRREPASVVELARLNLEEEGVVGVGSQTLHQLHVGDKGRLAALHARLKALEEPARFQVFRKEESPAEWHFREHPHIGDLLIVARPGHVLLPSADDLELAGAPPFMGVHGYPAADEPALHGIFYAWGPHIRPGSRLPALANVHVAPLVSRLLGLPAPAGIDGDPGFTASLIEE